MTVGARAGLPPFPLRFRAIAVLGLALLVGTPAPALLAQAGGETGGGPIVTRVPLSARGVALAGSFVLAGRDADLLFFNPALLERARGVEVTAQRWGRDGRVAGMAAGTEWLGGGAGLGLRTVEYRAPLATEAPPARDAGERLAFSPEDGAATVGATESAVTAGYGRSLAGFRVGGTVSAVQVRWDQDGDETAVLDLGVARDLGWVTVGVSGGGIGPALRDDLPTGVRRVEKWVAAGAGTQAKAVGPLDASGAVAVTLHEGTRVEAGGGVEVAWWPVQGRTLVGRVGLGGPDVAEASRFSWGAGFLGDSFAVEYAWRDLGEVPALHVVSLRFR